MFQFLTGLFGDRPARTIIKLLILSLIVGYVFSKMGWKPLDVPKELWMLLLDFINWGLSSFGDFVDMLLVGAIIVVPIFIIRRFLNRNKK